MHFRILIFGIMATVLASCVSKEDHEKIKEEYALLSGQMEEQNRLLTTMDAKMDSIGVLLDSIEMAESKIVLNLEQGIRYDDYMSRLTNIQQYMLKTNKQLQDLEKALKGSASKNSVYEKVIANYKRMLAEKDSAISQLTERIANYEMEKTALVKTVDLQNEEITYLQRQVEQQQTNLLQIETDLITSKGETVKSRAEKYFSLAQTLEALGDKTSSLLNGKKKKAYYRQAHENYQKAFEIDGDLKEAFVRMTELENKF